MATVASIVTNLRANTGQFDKALDGAKRRLKEVQTYTQQLQARESAAANTRKAAFADERREQMHAGKAASFQGTIESLAAFERSAATTAVKTNQAFTVMKTGIGGVFGPRGDIAQFAKMLRGGGALLGLGLLANSFGRVGDAVKQASLDMANGLKTFRDVIAELVQSTPFLGGFIRGGAGLIGSIDTGKGSIFSWHAAEAKAQDANTRFLKMMEDMQSAERGATPRGAVNEAARKKLSDLMGMRDTGGIGSRQFEIGKEAIERDRDKQLANLPGGKNVVADLINTSFRDILPDSVFHIRNRLEIGVNQFIGQIENGLKAASDLARQRENNQAIEAAQREQKEEEENAQILADAEAAASLRDQFVSGAASIYERLKGEQGMPVQFANAIEQGGQQDFAMRQQALFGPQMAKKNEEQLWKDAIAIYNKQLVEQERIREGIDRLVGDEGVGFN